MDSRGVVVKTDIWIDAPPERVWQAITNHDQIMKWWGDTWIIPELKVGGGVEFGRPGDMIHATIAVLDPPHQFSIHWPSLPDHPSDNVYTIYDLKPENGGTLLIVTETGYESLLEDERQQRMERTKLGYIKVLENLKAYIEG